MIKKIYILLYIKKMNDIQTEMIMNSDSSNIVSDILKELNTPTQMASAASHAPIHVQMQERAQPVQPNQSNLGLNENGMPMYSKPNGTQYSMIIEE